MKRLLVVLAGAVLVAILSTSTYLGAQRQSQETRASGGPGTKTIRSCESLTSVQLPDTVIKSAALWDGGKIVPAPCLITASVVHPAGDEITVYIGLPTANWNGRFQGTGGEGFSVGDMQRLRGPISQGFAAAATNGGHDTWGASFVLDANGRLNWHSVRDYAQTGIHEMTRVGKALTEVFYGTAPARSYFEGCSAGGRQAMMEAQRFPTDYDGIVAGAPSVSFPQVRVAVFWPAILMHTVGAVPLSCKLRAATTAVLESCDARDGLKDGIVNDPRTCSFDPRSLVGREIDGCGRFTEADAEIVQGIWNGPRRRDGSFMWHGFEPGTFIEELVDDAQKTARIGRVDAEWWRFFLFQDPKWQFSPIGRPSYEQVWDQSVEQYGAVVGTDSTDLSAFKSRSGKLLMWHGWLDSSTPARGTIDYYTRVQEGMGGEAATTDFARLFLAPGVGHCGGGDGFAPGDRMAAMVKWVEEGIGPESLPGVRWHPTEPKIVARRPVCRYPLIARFSGTGDVSEASAFSCQAN